MRPLTVLAVGVAALGICAADFLARRRRGGYAL